MDKLWKMGCKSWCLSYVQDENNTEGFIQSEKNKPNCLEQKDKETKKKRDVIQRIICSKIADDQEEESEAMFYKPVEMEAQEMNKSGSKQEISLKPESSRKANIKGIYEESLDEECKSKKASTQIMSHKNIGLSVRKQPSIGNEIEEADLNDKEPLILPLKMPSSALGFNSKPNNSRGSQDEIGLATPHFNEQSSSKKFQSNEEEKTPRFNQVWSFSLRRSESQSAKSFESVGSAL